MVFRKEYEALRRRIEALEAKFKQYEEVVLRDADYKSTILVRREDLQDGVASSVKLL